MRLIGIVYLVSFCGHLDVAPIDVTSELSALVKRIFWTSWNTLNNTKFNPDVILTPEMIRKAGYPVEAHVIMTEDGYLLTLHRIPGGNGSLPVLLQHALFCNSAVWVVPGKGRALAYLLADQGYDVWLGNFRGNTYSRAHISLSSTNSTFWNFSFNEMGIYDLPAMITFITNMRLQPLHTYIGHSMGATSFYIMASERPEIARMVKMMISLAPSALLDHMTSPVQYLLPLMDTIMMRFLLNEFLLNDSVRFLLKYACALAGEAICANVIFTFCGYDMEQFDHTLLLDSLSFLPAGGSVNTMIHYSQIFQSGKFRRYDYGRAKNLLIYDSAEPPNYNLSNIMVSIVLFYGSGDTLVDIVDLKRLSCTLPNVMDVYEVPWPNFNHADFIWAKDASKLVYERVLEIMRKENPNNVTSSTKIKDECYTLNL
ncbi:unnamed protein product [Lasius platythorax]|uniref:Lipase n=1 Tax=Lasius platythorax TaxID=488582 RepID=A0AAV2NTY9_9HYME